MIFHTDSFCFKRETIRMMAEIDNIKGVLFT